MTSHDVIWCIGSTLIGTAMFWLGFWYRGQLEKAERLRSSNTDGQ